MEIRHVTPADKAIWMQINPHAKEAAFDVHVRERTGYVLWECEIPIGVMHHCMIWDSLPFLNLLYIREKYRMQGFGHQAMTHWEAHMKAQGCDLVLISTQANEDAQHFYRKIGYGDCGGFVLNPREPMELIMRKAL
ncbi:MAG: GNAT family N-acetyltransferase [Clostridia bacterium]|nr:GNAT family N-acetyltransferase [Clostridia bacterium]